MSKRLVVLCDVSRDVGRLGARELIEADAREEIVQPNMVRRTRRADDVKTRLGFLASLGSLPIVFRNCC